MNDAKKPNARIAMEQEVKAAGRVAFGIFDQMFLGGALSSSAPKPPPPSDPYVKQFDLGAIVHYGHAGMQSAPCGATSGMADPDLARVTCHKCIDEVRVRVKPVKEENFLPPHRHDNFAPRGTNESDVVESKTIDAPVCPTCAGKGKLGAVGHEIVCPTCKGTGEDRSPKVCPTCQGTKKLGAPGHEIECPQCDQFGKKVSR